MIYVLYYYSYWLLIPAFLFALWAQIKVNSTFNRSNKLFTGMTPTG